MMAPKDRSGPLRTACADLDFRLSKFFVVLYKPRGSRVSATQNSKRLQGAAMDSLSMATVRKLMLAIERINSVSSLESFGPEAFAAIAEVLPEAFISLEQLSLTTAKSPP
jgi:hypothetical protein